MTEENEIPKVQQIFISRIDNYVGKNIGKYLSTQIPGIGTENNELDEEFNVEKISEPDGTPSQKKNCFVIDGTYGKFGSGKPVFARDILNYERRTSFQEHIIKYDIVVYDITENSNLINEALWVAESMEKVCQQFDTLKKFILITNLMSWTNTKPNDPDDPSFSESEYRRRKPHHNYKEYFDAEKTIIRLGKKYKKKFLTYVLACGIFYGGGEFMFQHYFKQAWLTQKPLPIYLDGQNILPTIHILDLARVIQAIADNPPKQRYIIVKDDSMCTQKEIIKAISSGLGLGATEHYTLEQLQNDQVPISTIEHLTLNLRIEPSTIKEEMQFNWISESGIPNSMPRLINEFIEEHNFKPLRICILGPPYVGKTTLAKELCKLYRLHHIHLRGLLSEHFRNLMEPVRALEHLKAIREEERMALEAAATAIAADDDIDRITEANESDNYIKERKRNSQKLITTIDNGRKVNFTALTSSELRQTGERTVNSFLIGNSETSDYEEYKYTMTADEVPSIKRSSLSETTIDMEYYPMGPLPMWNSEEELEILAADCQAKLEQLRENSDDSGRLNDETIVGILRQKLLTCPCRNQGFVIDGFPKTLQQAELLFKPDPDDEVMGNDKFPKSNRLITPHFVFVLEGSNELILHRFNRQTENSGLDPEQALVILPIWSQSLKMDKSITTIASIIEPIQSEMKQKQMENSYVENSENKLSNYTDSNELDQMNEKNLYKLLETHKQRFVRRLDNYRSAMSPAAAVVREALIAAAEQLIIERGEKKDNKNEESVEHEPTNNEETDPTTKQYDQINLNQENTNLEKDAQNHEPDQVYDSMQDHEKDVGRDFDSHTMDNINKDENSTDHLSNEAKISQIPPLPEVPSETEENVLAYFDIREIHPVYINMDKDFSLLVHPSGPQEECLRRVRKAIGYLKAPPLPYTSALPPRVGERDSWDQPGLNERITASKIRKARSLEQQQKRQQLEDKKLQEKQQDVWNEWLALIKTQNYQHVEAHSLPMRHYLMRYVMPELTNALLACSSIRPDDPIDFVAEYLLKTGLNP